MLIIQTPKEGFSNSILPGTRRRRLHQAHRIHSFMRLTWSRRTYPNVICIYSMVPRKIRYRYTINICCGFHFLGSASNRTGERALVHCKSNTYNARLSVKYRQKSATCIVKWYGQAAVPRKYESDFKFSRCQSSRRFIEYCCIQWTVLTLRACTRMLGVVQ